MFTKRFYVGRFLLRGGRRGRTVGHFPAKQASRSVVHAVVAGEVGAGGVVGAKHAIVAN